MVFKKIDRRIMTPKEKAEELVDKFTQTNGNSFFAKECALIAVDEILKSEPRSPSDVDWDDVGGTHQYYYEAQREEADKYWQQVKKEIEEL
jgi:hypothetical protein